MKIRRSSVAVAAAAASLLAVLTAPASAPAVAQTAPELPTLLGWAAGTGTAFREQLPQIEQQAGKTPALSMVSFRIGTNDSGGDTDWGQAWIPGLLSDLTELGTVPYLELETSNVGALADGRLDNEVDRMVGTLGGWLRGDASRRLLIAPLPEMNLKEHQWGLQPTAYKLSYHRIRGAFHDAGVDADQIRFVFAPNGLSSEGTGSYPRYYPGDGAVDIVGFAKLNRGTPWRDYAETFQMHIDEMRRTVTTSKPILITQTGSVTSGGNRAAWLHDMFTRLDAHDQVIGAVYFNRNKDHDYRVLVDGTLDATFRNDYRTYWSAPSQVSFVYDGSLDAWVRSRGGTPAARFADTARSPFRADIEWVADAGITAGCNPDHYCPSHAVTRAQMATFLARALDLPATRTDHFTDD
ncbi:MAG: S-layer homology domain-containing protein, partial [Actinobacteria bacterium]|nr:S-layer homology domain-containing protein [Actinomycetota bacterium]